jgi:hypothetical protein
VYITKGSHVKGEEQIKVKLLLVPHKALHKLACSAILQGQEEAGLGRWNSLYFSAKLFAR